MAVDAMLRSDRDANMEPNASSTSGKDARDELEDD